MEKQKLKEEYFVMFVVRLGIILLTHGMILYFALNKTTLIPDNSVSDNALFFGIIIALSIAAIFILFEFMKYSKDFKDAKKQRFEEVTGSVIKFAKNQDTETGRQMNCIPIIQISGSEKTIKLKVNESLRIGETYTFIYLKNSKLGAVKTLK